MTVAATGSCRNGGRPGSATSRFQSFAQRKPVGSTRAIAETSSRLVEAIGSSADRGRDQHRERVLGRELELRKRSGLAADPAGRALGVRRVEDQPAAGGVPAGDRRRRPLPVALPAASAARRRGSAGSARPRRKSEAACGQRA